MRLLVMVTFAGGALTGPALRNVLYNLPLLLAFDVLRQTLTKARDEKAFSCASQQLGTLMDSAKSYLSWNNWPELRDGVRRRNEVAHDGRLFGGEQCLRDIANVEEQLVSWGIVEAGEASLGGGRE